MHSHLFRVLIRFLFRLDYFGPLVLGIADSSFLVLPFGNDLLIVGLVSRHANRLPIYVLMATIGSTLGIFLLDLVARRLGEEGIRKMAGQERYEKLKCKVGERSGAAVVLAALSPPPFPFTIVMGMTSALGYPRPRLLGFAGLARAIRFTIIGLLAVRVGEQVIRVTKSPAFEWCMGGFIAICLIASVISGWKWIRPKERREGK